MVALDKNSGQSKFKMNILDSYDKYLTSILLAVVLRNKQTFKN